MPAKINAIIPLTYVAGPCTGRDGKSAKPYALALSRHSFVSAEEFILDLFGAGQVIAKAVPAVLAAFLPPVGIGILVGSVVYVALVLISSRKREDDRKKFKIVYELEPLLRVVGLKMKTAESVRKTNKGQS